MIADLVQQFAGSSEAAKLLGQLQGQGLSADQAQGAITARAEGAAEALQGGGLAGLLGGGGGGGGIGSALGGMLGGGGALGGMLGGGGAGGGVAGLPASVVKQISATVATKTGLSEVMATTAVSLVLPRVVDFVKSKLGG